MKLNREIVCLLEPWSYCTNRHIFTSSHCLYICPYLSYHILFIHSFRKYLLTISSTVLYPTDMVENKRTPCSSGFRNSWEKVCLRGGNGKFKSHETGLSSEHLMDGQKATLLEWKKTMLLGRLRKSRS